MATSTPGRSALRPTILNAGLSLSPAVREIVELSPPSAAPALAVRTTPRGPRDVANSSLPQRVPRSFRQIMGRRPVHMNAMSSKGRTKENIPKLLKINSTKPNAEAPKLEPPKKTPKHTQTEADGSLLAPKRKYSPEGTPPVKPSTSTDAARGNAVFSLTPSAAPTCPYQVLQLCKQNRPIGLLILNMDQLKQQGPNQGQGDSAEITELTPERIEETSDEDTPPPENPDNNFSESLPKKEPPNTKNCLIM
ncbi:hypothetical protein KR032_006187 [Drosophila birchii]|nr:hypothetical protein KR032_006187 [Drosophila birchii]